VLDRHEYCLNIILTFPTRYLDELNHVKGAEITWSNSHLYLLTHVNQKHVYALIVLMC